MVSCDVFRPSKNGSLAAAQVTRPVSVTSKEWIPPESS